MNVGPSTFDKFSVKGKRERVWTVRWKSAIANLFEGGNFSGQMEEVTGSIYQQGNEAATFRAGRGEAVKASETLTLSRDVRLVAKETGIVMTCDRVIYEANKKLIKAMGNIRIEGKAGVIRGVDELWTTPDLKQIATPDMWSQRS